ncbi:MAG: UvrD-helicase domain-containing protein [Bacteroidetes bacterium]|nr:UvrD-helicase domain-containing protein [Bacteroidota bacterium]
MPIQVRAEKALKNILHDYSNFSVSTIDSFFQKILRALAREIHLPLKMEVEVSTDDAILSVTEALFREIGNDKELTEWLTDLAMQKIDLDKGWNIENDISLVAKEIFRESSHHDKILTRLEIKNIYDDLIKRRSTFVKKMEALGKEALAAMAGAGCSVDDFSYKSTGVAGYFLKIIKPKKFDDYAPTDRAIKGMEGSDAWFSKSSPRKNELEGFVSSTLIPILNKANQLFTEGFRDYVTADEVLKKIYLFGLVNDLQSKFREYRRENNVILLADTTRLLSDVIEGNDTPFIYEKTGNRYKHLLIDEFQDTSLLQWQNLMPLVINTLGSGFITLVVGDAKQSIYRWRGGNMNLLIRDIFIDLVNFRSLFKEEALSTNYRSKKEVVHFNNSFFETATEIIGAEPEMKDHSLLGLAYGKDLAQEVAEKNTTGGYVEIGFIDSDEIETPEEDEKADWKDEAMRRMLAEIRTLIDEKKYIYRDIAILVRSNVEGNKIATYLLENGIEKIISPDSLMLSSSPKITFLLNVFRFLSHQENEVARAELLYYYARFISQKDIPLHSVFSDHKNSPSLAKRKNEQYTF